MADALSDARTRYLDAMSATREQRQQIEEDLAFSDPSNPQQWDDTERRQRETDPGGARPCLVFDHTQQYVANVAGQVEQRPPAIHAIPVGSGADQKVAEKLDGFFRHIEHTSRAPQHYARALTSAARAGVGYLIVRPEYTDRALNYQEPRISSEGDPLRVVFDPWSVELDGSDATWGQLLTPYSETEFKRRWGEKAELVSFGETEARKSDDRESIVVAEEWRVIDAKKNVIVCADENGDQVSMSEDEFHIARQAGQSLHILWNYSDKVRTVRWLTMSGADVLKETEYPASGIGIVPVYGYVGWSGGRMRYCGIPRRAREPQRAYNFHASEVRVLMAQAPKSPWLASVRAIRGLENIWDKASAESRAYLPFNDVDPLDPQGAPVAPPVRMPVAANLQNHIAGLMQAKDDIQASLGMYQANLGAPSNETSGVAIESRKQQGEASTAHFPAHLAAALGQIGKLCMEMVPRIIDTPRQLRILGIDSTAGSVRIDPKQPKAVQELESGGLSINPNVGRYDVRVVVGASFSTQRQQAQEAYTEIMRAAPQLMPAIAPLWAQSLDVPHADKLAQVLTAMAPDPVKAILQPDGQDNTAALKAQLDQMKQALQEAVQHAHAAQQDADQAQAECEQLRAEADAKEDEVSIKAYDALTKRLQVLGTTLSPEGVQALVVQTMEQMLSAPDPMQQETPVDEAQEALTEQQEPTEAAPMGAGEMQ